MGAYYVPATDYRLYNFFSEPCELVIINPFEFSPRGARGGGGAQALVYLTQSLVQAPYSAAEGDKRAFIKE